VKIEVNVSGQGEKGKVDKQKRNSIVPQFEEHVLTFSFEHGDDL
jgi:hypothetical protein